MDYQTLQIERHPAHVVVWLNRPDLRNAFDETLIRELTHAFQHLGQDSAVRVIVLAAKGTVFCAGADLNWMQRMAEYGYAENLQDAALLAKMLHTLYLCPKPVLARVQGDCYAGGMGLVAACDIVLAADSANFCLSEVRLGLIPATISPYVIKAIGEPAARRYFLTAEKFSARQACQMGLVHEALSAERLDTRMRSVIEALLAASPHALAQAKRLVRDIANQPLNEHLVADTVGRIAEIRASSEGREGVRAFLEKRKPSWQL